MTNEAKPEPQLMTIDQLSDFTQIPKQTLYRWRSEGVGPPGLRLGRHVRYRRSDVDAWLGSPKGQAAP